MPSPNLRDRSNVIGFSGPGGTLNLIVDTGPIAPQVQNPSTPSLNLGVQNDGTPLAITPLVDGFVTFLLVGSTGPGRSQIGTGTGGGLLFDTGAGVLATSGANSIAVVKWPARRRTVFTPRIATS